MSALQKIFCSDLAREYGLSLVGTATRGDIWFLLEYSGRWGAKALDESALDPQVIAHLQEARYPGVESRALLIKQEHLKTQEGIRFFIVKTHPQFPELYEYQLVDYRDLLSINLAALVAGQPGDPAHLRTEPLYLVCANGKRDQCCSIYGPEAYQAMQAEAGEAVWQSSHIGGHNRAPTMLFFPHGLNYGQATPAEARRLVQAYQQNKVVLHNYRGRVCFDPPAQAAEHFWRQQTGILELPGLQIEAVAEIGANQWQVTLRSADGLTSDQIRLQRRVSDYNIPLSCNQQKSAPVISFHRLD